MKDRSAFLGELNPLGLTHVARCVALLWYYRQTQEFEERSATELANDLQDVGYPKPNVTRLAEDLKRSRFVVKGRRAKTFQLDARRIAELDERYGPVLELRKVRVTGAVLPVKWFAGSRPYLERLVHEINGCYEYGFYDGSAVLCRRLMESLIIEVYVHDKRHHEIQSGGVFLPLERLISHVRADPGISLGRNTPKTMVQVKEMGDVAAHDRAYITQQSDIDDVRAAYRRVISELSSLAGMADATTV